MTKTYNDIEAVNRLLEEVGPLQMTKTYNDIEAVNRLLEEVGSSYINISLNHGILWI